jgi:hypothetical protein
MIEYKYNTNTIQIQYKYYNSKTRLTDTGIPEVRVSVKRDLEIDLLYNRCIIGYKYNANTLLLPTSVLFFPQRQQTDTRVANVLLMCC